MTEYGFTVKENELLNMLAAWELDGIYDTHLRAKNGTSIWFAITRGIPMLNVEEPVIRKVENGKLVHTLGKTITVDPWDTEERLLDFLRTYGKCIDNPLVQEYAKSFAQDQRPLLIWPLTPERVREYFIAPASSDTAFRKEVNHDPCRS